MKRKEFLKLSAIGAAGTTMLSAPLLGRAFAPNQLTNGSSFQVIIVGTGYGSAVTALRLGQAGIKCLMLEMGMDWKKSGMKFSGMAWAEKQSTWLRNTTVAPFANYRLFEKFTGALDRLDFENVKVYAGRGIGGGSLVNGGMSVTPRKDYFEEIFPELNSEDFYTKYFPRANEGLGVETIPEEYYQKTEYYQFSRTGEEEGVAAGYKPVRVPNVYDYDYMQKEERGEVEKSALGGEVIYGNNHGKKDLTKTYIKEALETGNVSILGLHKVEQIIQNDDNTYTIAVNEINTKGEVVASKNFKSAKLFLGAGSMGTTELLLKSKAKGSLPNLDDQIGKYWGNNGNTMASRQGLKKPLGGKQSTMPAAGLEKWSKTNDAIFAEIAPFPIGIDFRIALYLVINRVPEYGTITYNEADDKIEMDWGAKQNSHMVKNAGDFLDNMSKVNGGSRGSTFPNGIDPTICYHPLGGCVLNRATDAYGRVNNHDGLYVVDGALIPASIGVNPYVTITAIAEYIVEELLRTDLVEGAPTVEEFDINLIAAPNPFKTYLDLSFNSPIDTTVQFTLHNWANVKVGEAFFDVSKGQQTVRWENLSYLWAERYVLTLKIGSQVITTKVQKSWF